MNKFILKVRRFFWTYRQPLTLIPRKQGAPISDLFIWRKSKHWQTGFELTDIGSLFDNEIIQKKPAKALFILFDLSGRELGRHLLTAPRFKSTQVDISALLTNCIDEIGTFCVLHLSTPSALLQLGSNITERGYVSYMYCNTPARAYVHGNFDAVSMNVDGRVERLAGKSFFQREFHLQYLFEETGVYEVVLVNPSSDQQRITFEVLSVVSGKEVTSFTTNIPSGGLKVFTIPTNNLAQRVIIKSYLIMARPIIFYRENSKLAVFHG